VFCIIKVTIKVYRLLTEILMLNETITTKIDKFENSVTRSKMIKISIINALKLFLCDQILYVIWNTFGNLNLSFLDPNLKKSKI